MELSRRSFIGAIIGAAAAPAIIRTPGLIMPIKSALIVDPDEVDAEWAALEDLIYQILPHETPGLTVSHEWVVDTLPTYAA